MLYECGFINNDAGHASAVSNVLLSSLAGFAFAELRFRGRDALLVCPLYIPVTGIGMYGKLSALIVPALVSAVDVFWMRQAVEENVPDELAEAARVDGAGLPRTYWHVVVPGLRTTATVLGMFTFMFAWNDCFWPLIALPRRTAPSRSPPATTRTTP
ncbi:carbohydrate ABC transporter permease [Streptomyces sp. NPDC090056]